MTLLWCLGQIGADVHALVGHSFPWYQGLLIQDAMLITMVDARV